MNLPLKSESDVTVTTLEQSGWLQKKTCSWRHYSKRNVLPEYGCKGDPKKIYSIRLG